MLRFSLLELVPKSEWGWYFQVCVVEVGEKAGSLFSIGFDPEESYLYYDMLWFSLWRFR